MLLDALGDEGLQDLALVALFQELEGLTRELLGDRAGALRHLARAEVFFHRTTKADVIDAVMLEVAGVFLRHERVDEMLRHVGDRHWGAV